MNRHGREGEEPVDNACKVHSPVSLPPFVIAASLAVSRQHATLLLSPCLDGGCRGVEGESGRGSSPHATPVALSRVPKD